MAISDSAAASRIEAMRARRSIIRRLPAGRLRHAQHGVVLLHDHQHRRLVIARGTGGIEHHAQGVGIVVVLVDAMGELQEPLEATVVAECFTLAGRKRRYGYIMFNASRGICARTARFTGAIVVLATASMLAPGADAAGSCDATSHEDALELVRETTKALFTAVDAYDGVISDNPADARALVEEYITPHVDLKGSSKLVLGKYWKRATPEQQERFLTQFHALMLRTYATAVTSYTGIQIEYLPMREEKRANFATVRTLIPRNQGEDVLITYRLHCRRNVWKVFDVSIAGVSMVTTYRTAFSAEVRKSGIEGLIKALEEKNGELGA